MLSDVLGQRLPLDVFQDQIRARLLAAGKRTIENTHQRRMIKILQGAHIAEQHGDIRIEAVGPQRLDDDLPVVGSLTAQKRDAEAAGAEDALRLIACEGERLESIAVESNSTAQS